MQLRRKNLRLQTAFTQWVVSVVPTSVRVVVKAVVTEVVSVAVVRLVRDIRDKDGGDFTMAEEQKTTATNTTQTGSSTKVWGMKYYKLYIYFGAWLAIVLNGISAIRQFTGAAYGNAADLIYAALPGLKALDVFYGIILIALAVWSFVTRTKLKDFREDAPKTLLLMQIFNLITFVGYIWIFSNLLNVRFFDALDGRNATRLIANFVVLICTTIYFQHRKHLFVC